MSKIQTREDYSLLPIGHIRSALRALDRADRGHRWHAGRRRQSVLVDCPDA
jgi:hypothetical protein